MTAERVLFLALVVYFLVTTWFFVDLCKRIKKQDDRFDGIFRRLCDLEREVPQVKLSFRAARNVVEEDIKGLRVDVDQLREDVLDIQEPAKENAAAEARVLQGLENLLDYSPDIARKAVKGDV